MGGEGVPPKEERNEAAGDMPIPIPFDDEEEGGAELFRSC